MHHLEHRIFDVDSTKFSRCPSQHLCNFKLTIQLVDNYKGKLLNERRARQPLNRQHEISGGPVTPVILLLFLRHLKACPVVVHLARAICILFSKLGILPQYGPTVCESCVLSHAFLRGFLIDFHMDAFPPSFQVTEFHTNVDFPILLYAHHTVTQFPGTFEG